jgi:cell filamentation protein
MNSRSSYNYPDIDVLRNKANIRDAHQLREFEYRRSTVRGLELDVTPVQGKFDLKHLQAIHKHLFQDVYDWAGKIRTVPSSKKTGIEKDHVSVFANPGDITQDWQALEKKTTEFVASNRGYDEKLESLTGIFIEANRIHAFPEGKEPLNNNLNIY